MPTTENPNPKTLACSSTCREIVARNRVKLKNVKHSASLSQETEAYTASVYLDGKKVGHVRNDGNGGPDFVELDIRFREPRATSDEINSVYDKLQAACRAHPEFLSFCEEIGAMPESIDAVSNTTALLLERHLEDKQVRRVCKKGIVLRLADVPEGSFEVHNLPYNAANVAAVREEIAREGREILEVVNERFQK